MKALASAFLVLLSLATPLRAQSAAVIPSSAPTGGGTAVRIRRAGIGDCGAACAYLKVAFGEADGVSARVINAGEIEAIAPPHKPGRVDVTIYYSSTGASVTLPSAFLYYDHAEGPPSEAFERILIPLMFEGAGAFGSQWTSELAVRNRSDAGIDPWNPLVRCGADERCRPQIPPGATLHLAPATLGDWFHGLLFAVPREQADDLDFSLHIRDLSRQAESFGTEIPVVRERELPRTPIALLDVPLNDRFRTMLRIYDVAAIDGAQVVMRYRLDDGSLYGSERRLTLSTLIRCVTEPCWFPEPAGIAIPLFDQPSTPAPGQDHLHVEIEPLHSESRIWAFVTVTNNETQQVTTITP